MYNRGDLYVASLDLKAGTVLSVPQPLQHGLYGRPSWSPDGQYLAYCVRRTPDPSSIHIRSLATGEERVLDPNLATIAWLIWSPDGRSLLATVGGVYGPDAKGLMRSIYQIDVETGTTNLLLRTEAQGPRRPQLSPDGRSLAYEVRDAVLVRDLKTGREKRIFEFLSPPSYLNCWDLSPDGKRLVISGAGHTSPSQLKIISFEGAQLKELLPEKWDEVGEVAWAPDGKSVLFTVGGELWQISAEGGQPRKLFTNKFGWWASLRVHPDGRHIAFHAYYAVRELWVMENFLPTE